ncbi:MAG TPA: amidophosphoribosyltransferase [Spirochaetota bacterium]|nr:amidophosphoribosyltransferase [Spirochaetota bacterium]
MIADVKHNCGVAAVSIPSPENSSAQLLPLMYKMLLNMQNRGQLSAGITTYNINRPQIIDTYKDTGSVNRLFEFSGSLPSNHTRRKMDGSQAIGHVRYATAGVESKEYAQPFERHHGRKWKWFSFCFNGNLANYTELKKNLLDKTDYHIIRGFDTEIIMHYLAYELRHNKKPDLVRVFHNLSVKFDGAYNIAFINADGDMVIARDPLGIRPLCYGWCGNILLAASESIALANCGVKDIKPLPPGNMIIITDGKAEVKQYAESRKKAHCFFEWIYFANAASVIDNQSVYKTRTALGKELARMEQNKIDDDYVITSVPDTSRPTGDNMAFELGVRPVEGIMRNRYIGRTFITGSNRASMVSNKYILLKDIIKNKKVILIDDSLVRGSTMKKLVNYLKKEGEVKEVHVRIACPPVMAPCFYGIDMSTVTELFAAGFADHNNNILPPSVLAEMASALHADSLAYVPVKSIPACIGLPEKDLCMACLNNSYPTPWGRRLYKKAKLNSGKNIAQRTYEC